MAKLGNFSVTVIPGIEQENGYVLMNHNTQYELCLMNMGSVDCDANVVIDGKQVGLWRVTCGNKITIQRPTNDTGRFTFYRLGSDEAGKASLAASTELGLISVAFKPEKIVELPNNPEGEDSTSEAPRYSLGSAPRESIKTSLGFGLPSKTRKVAAGGTGLSGKSEQKFVAAIPIQYDEELFTEIHLRLVCSDEQPRPLVGRSTPIPPPVTR